MFREEYGLAVPSFTEHKPQWHVVKEPYSGEVVGQVELLSEEGLNVALDIAGAASAIHRFAPYERAEILKKVSAAIAERAEHFALLIAREGGKPLQDARVEVGRASYTLSLCAEEATRNAGRETFESSSRKHKSGHRNSLLVCEGPWMTVFLKIG